MTDQQDAAFLRTFGLVLGFLVVFTIVIIIVANVVTSGSGERAASKVEQDAINERLAPIASVNVAGSSATDAAGAAPAAAKSGKDIVAAACNACHATGAAGHQKSVTRLPGRRVSIRHGQHDEQWITARAMPAREAICADDDIKAAIISMLQDTGFGLRVLMLYPQQRLPRPPRLLLPQHRQQRLHHPRPLVPIWQRVRMSTPSPARPVTAWVLLVRPRSVMRLHGKHASRRENRHSSIMRSMDTRALPVTCRPRAASRSSVTKMLLQPLPTWSQRASNSSILPEPASTNPLIRAGFFVPTTLRVHTARVIALP